MDREELIDVIVIGGGAAGLIAARNLARTGARVIVLEARGRLGGRILTRRPIGSSPVELGAGFVHGDNEVLWELVHEADAHTADSPEAQWLLTERGLERHDELWDRLTAVMKQIDADNFGSFGAWLAARQGNVSEQDRVLAREFVENFHGGPEGALSAAVLRETRGGTEDSQHVLVNGYDRIPLALAQQCYSSGVQLYLNATVRSIDWEPGHVSVTTRGDSDAEKRVFPARAAVVTVPLGVLKARPGQLGAIEFRPALSEKQTLWQELPFGFVARLTLKFRPAIWSEPLLPQPLREQNGKRFGFVHAPGAPFPVWWSASPDPILVAWAGGPRGRALAGKTQEEVVRIAVHTLAETLGCSASRLSELLEESFWHDWSADPYSRGGYSFTVAGWEDAPRRLGASVEDTLFFAGEATAEPAELGTVGGALASGERAAREVRRAIPLRPPVVAPTGEFDD